jgi:hypothetical protein
MLFGVYLLIRKRAVLRYIYRLRAVYVSLLAPKGRAKHVGILTYFQTKVNKIRIKKAKDEGRRIGY